MYVCTPKVSVEPDPSPKVHATVLVLPPVVSAYDTANGAQPVRGSTTMPGVGIRGVHTLVLPIRHSPR